MSSAAIPRASAGRIAIGVVAAVLAAVVVNALIAVLALAAGASEDFEPLQPSAYAFLTVVGVLAGAAGWAAVRRDTALAGAGCRRRLAPARRGTALHRQRHA